MKARQTAPDLTPDEAADFEEYTQRKAHLLAEMESGVISPVDYKRLKAEAWEVFRVRTGRLDLDEEEFGGSPTQSAD